MSSVNLNNIGNVNSLNVGSLDIETALMAVQSQRATLLEGQLQSQLADVQARNAQIGKLNDTLSAARNLQACFKSDAKAEDGFNKNVTDSGKASAALSELKTAAEAAGVSLNVTNKGELDKAVENLKSMIDSQSNSQQMDMLRLQSLSNKRNEAFDLMTNFVKKMQDSRSSIIGNMR